MRYSLFSIITAAFMLVSTKLCMASELVIATVNNSHMIEMQKLSAQFEQENADITLKWVTMEEGVLRQRVTTDIATKGGQFDVMTIGMYEAPIWGAKGWLNELTFDADYDVEDIIPAIRDGLSDNGKLYAAPFYGESSILMYRKDLADAAGVSFDYRPTWQSVAKAAAAMHDPLNGVYGICLRGKPGWGDNMAFLSTLVNTFGGQWFDMNWKPQLTSPAWQQAVSFYVDIMTKYGPPGSTANSFNELLALTSEGKCAMWIDASIAASFVSNPDQSKVADKMAFVQSPTAKTPKGANWLWSWALAIPNSSKNAEAAKKFISWATSKQYIQHVGNTLGWGHVPTGTRQSTYAIDAFISQSKYAQAELDAINSANPSDSTLNPSPYKGVQFAAIPEFQAIGIAVGQLMAEALAGDKTVEEALAQAQRQADRFMRRARYY